MRDIESFIKALRLAADALVMVAETGCDTTHTTDLVASKHEDDNQDDDCWDDRSNRTDHHDANCEHSYSETSGQSPQVQAKDPHLLIHRFHLTPHFHLTLHFLPL